MTTHSLDSELTLEKRDKRLIRKQVFNVTTITFFGQFASYAIASIFILFLTLPIVKDGLGMSEKEAYQFMGVTQAIGYMMPLIGGYVIDKYVGLRRGITFGVALLAVSYGLVYLGSMHVHDYGRYAFIAAYALIPAINALVSSPSSALVSRIYKGDDAGSKSGMTLYYMSINVGSLIAIGVSPLLMNSTWGVMSVLAIVFIGKGLAALNFIVRRPLYDNVTDGLDKTPMTMKRWIPFLGYLVGGYTLAFIAYLNPFISTYVVGAGCLLGISTFCIRTLLLDGVDRTKQLVATFLIVVAIVFFVLYNQMATTMVMFTKNNTDLSLFGIHLEPAQFQMINPIIILAIGALLPRLYRQFKGFTIPYQFAVGVCLAGTAMLALSFGASQASPQGIASANYVGLAYFLVTIAELFVSAVGLSMIGLYCHPKMIAFAMGAWYLSASMSNLITGQLGKLVAIPKSGLDQAVSIKVYGDFFFNMGNVAILIGLGLLVVMYFLQRNLKERGIHVA